MEKCLINKLKEVANNDSLEILGGFVYHFKSGNEGLVYHNYASGKDVGPIHIYAPTVTISRVESGSVLVDEHNIESVGSFWITEENKEFDAVITNKYNLSEIAINNDNYFLNTKVLHFCNDLSSFSVTLSNNNISPIINFSDIPSEKLKALILQPQQRYNINFTGYFTEALRNCNPQLLQRVECKLNDLIPINTDITELLGSFTAITHMSFNNVTNMRGRIESFVSAQCTAALSPRTTGSITIFDGGWLGNVTFGDEPYTPASSIMTLQWEPDTTEGQTIISLGSDTETIVTTTGEIVG